MQSRWILLALGMFFISGAIAGHHEKEDSMTSSYADFEAFSQAMQGRWLAKIIWINDWPGFGKKGDEVTGYAEYQPGEGGRIINGRTYVGPGALTHLIYFDEGSKLIRETMVSSGGNVWNNTIYLKDGDWAYKVSGSTGEGKAITGVATREFSDDGQANKWLGQWEVDGEPLDPLRDSFQRLGD